MVTPFIDYAVAKTTAVGHAIDITKALNYVKDNFGYTDILQAVVEKILKRNSGGYYKKEYNKFILIKELNGVVEQLDRKKEECEIRINRIGESLYRYLVEHCHGVKNITMADSIRYLQQFFSRYGLYVGTERLYLKDISPRNYEIDYYIAQYIFDLKENNTIEYQYAIDLVKGFFLQAALYLQIDNNDLVSSSYRGVKFYYDTPFLLRILGYEDEHSCNSARELHKLLEKQGAKFYFFPQTFDEIDSILAAYENSLRGGYAFSNPPEGLAAKRYSPSDIERLRTIFADVLKSQYHINLADLPPYQQKFDGTVDESKVLPEGEAKEYVRNNTKHYREETLDADIKSALAIHRLRTSDRCKNIENCGAIFVTTNVDFTHAFNTFYKNKINHHTLPLIILDFDLASIAWIKCGSIGNMPERQLLTNAYIASVELMPDLIERLKDVLDVMTAEGKISSETALVLRSSHFVQRELLSSSHGNLANVTPNLVSDIIENYNDSIIQEYKADFSRKNLERLNEQKKRIVDKAREFAKERRNELLKYLTTAWIVVAVIIALIAIYYTIKAQKDLITSISQIIILLFACFSIYDTVKARNLFIHKLLIKISNRYETKVFENKKREYQRMLLSTSDQSENELTTTNLLH